MISGGELGSVILLLCIVIVQGQILYTTPFIDEVFQGKCLLKAGTTKSGIVASFPDTWSYCNELWLRFSSAAQLPSYLQTNETWAPFFEIGDFSSAPNTAMLWSGSSVFSQELSYRYTTLETTLTGYIINDLWWCPPDMQNSTFNISAPCAFNDSPPSGYYGLAPVWREASRRFASGISGEVVVLLQSRFDYSNPTAHPVTFRPDSIFATVELPTLVPDVVTDLVVVYTPGDRKYLPVENCGNGTLLNLRQAVTAKFSGSSTQYYCFDDIGAFLKLCTNTSTEDIANQVSKSEGISTLTALQNFAATFDFNQARAEPECAFALTTYFAGVDVASNIPPSSHLNSANKLSLYFTLLWLLFIGIFL